MNILEAAILGLVEGITEYLPISSTGHLIITSHLLGLHPPGNSAQAEQAVKDFEIVIQGGAILAVVALYWPRFIRMLRGLIGRDAAGLRLLVNLAIAFIPAAVVGLLAKKWIDAHLMKVGPVMAALMIGGVFMIVVDRLLIVPRRKEFAKEGVNELAALTPRGAMMIGLLQVFSLIPGTSRSMMTIVGGVFAGLRPAAAAEFSFLLGAATLMAASAYSLYKNLKESNAAGTENMFHALGLGPTLVGMLVAAISAFLAVKWLVAFLNRHGLTPFGVYRIAIGLVLLGLALAGWVQIG